MLHSILSISHIAAGIFVLLSGFAVFALPKGTKTHKQFGKVYAFAMFFLTLSGIVMSTFSGNVFLFSVSVFSLYLVLTGVRSIQTKLRKFGFVDYLFQGIISFCALAMLYLTGTYIGNGAYNLAIVLGLFGFGALALAIVDFKLLYVSTSKQPLYVNYHIGRIGGSFIAAITGFATNQFHFLPDLVNWIVPTVIGSIYLSFATRSWMQQNKQTV